MFTKEQVNAYIDSKKLAWSPTSTSSEQSRLHKLVRTWNALPAPTASALYEELSKKAKPYTVKTSLIRFSQFAAHATGNPDNEFKQFLAYNTRAFRNVYTIERVGLSYEEALKRVNTISEPKIKHAALLMLRTGLRIHEALKYDGSGRVIGKGAKGRTVYSDMAAVEPGIPYTAVWLELKKVGLKPHTLRKLAASKLVKSGFREADLMEVMGWNSIATASIYVQPTRAEELKRRMMEVLK